MNDKTRKRLMSIYIRIKNHNLSITYFLKETCPSCEFYCKCPKYCWKDGKPQNWEPNEIVLNKILEL